MEVTPAKSYNLVLDIPPRWDFEKRTHAQALEEIDRLAGILSRGAEALSGLYIRICHTLRQHNLTNDEIREVLSPHFAPPRVSEFIRIANAPPHVYRRYHGGFIAFRAALAECRGYQITSNEEIKRRKIRRTAERLIELMGPGEVEVCGQRVTVSAA